MRIADGLQHYGEITNPNDVNYYHGYGLGKRANRIGNGFYSQGAVWRRSDNFATSTYTGNLRAARRAIGVSPFYGLFYTLLNGFISVIDRNLNVIATHSVPDVSTGVKADGLVTIDGKGNGLIIADRKFYRVNPNGTIRLEKNHTIVGTEYTGTTFGWACVNPKKDVFVFSNSTGYYLVKLSTLEILNNKLYTSTRLGDRFFFLKNNKLVSMVNGNNTMIVLEINYENYTVSKENRYSIPVTEGVWTFMGINRKGNALLSNRLMKKIVTFNTEDGTITDFLTFTGSTSSIPQFVDFDEKYLYGYLTDGSSGSITNAVVHDIKTGLLVKNAGGSGTEPWQFKGKMPITEKFF